MPQLQTILRPLVAMYRAAGLRLLAALRDTRHNDFSRFTRQPNKNIFVGDRDFCVPFKELMRIRNYIARLVSASENRGAPPIQLLLSEITAFETTHADVLAELTDHCSSTRARDNDGGENDDGAKRPRTSPDTFDYTFDYTFDDDELMAEL